MDLVRYQEVVSRCDPVTALGRVEKVAGLVVEGRVPGVGLGGSCLIEGGSGPPTPAEVVGFDGERVLLMPYEQLDGIRLGSRIRPATSSPSAPVGEAFLGRIVDPLGRPVDGGSALATRERYPLFGRPINPMERQPIREPFDCGIRSVNAFVTLGRGQRVGILSGSGVGKSVLLGMIAANSRADVCVLALIGERGREVREFVENVLGPEAMKKTVVVAAAADTSPLLRIRGAYYATALAEYFRDQGRDVVLMMDSITRFAMSCRDVGLAAGEPPTVRGLTPSFFVKLPRLLERAGSITGRGSITGVYTVLTEDEDMNDPVADAVRSVVDGHVVLSRRLAHRNLYPAVDVLRSVSRVMKDVATEEHMVIAARVRELLAAYREAEDLISVGAYAEGSDPLVDTARKMMSRIEGFLIQGRRDAANFNASLSGLRALYAGSQEASRGNRT